MLCNPRQQLEDRIVTALGQRPRLAAKELHHKVQTGHRYSIQGLYKELRKLEADGVVVKQGLRYSLRIPWILELLELSNTLEKSYMTMARQLVDLPVTGKKQILHFNTLLQLNNYWAQVLLFLMHHVKEKNLYSYMPHPWYHLIYAEQELQYIEAVKRMHVRLSIINRGKTYLDRWVEQFWKQPHIEYSFHPAPLRHVPQNVYLNVIGEYVITVKLGAVITKDIEQLYSKTRNSEDINFPEMFRVLNQKIQATMWVEHNKKKAQVLKGHFHRHFGIARPRGQKRDQP